MLRSKEGHNILKSRGFGGLIIMPFQYFLGAISHSLAFKWILKIADHFFMLKIRLKRSLILNIEINKMVFNVYLQYIKIDAIRHLWHLNYIAFIFIKCP